MENIRPSESVEVLDIKQVTRNFENYTTYLINEVLVGNFPRMITTKTADRHVAVDFKNKNSRPKFAILIHIMSKCFVKIKNNEVGTIRDLFYENPQLYQTQGKMNSAIMDLCKSFNIPRSSLRVEATAKGLVAGDLKWIYKNGDETSITEFPRGMLIPSNIKEIEQFVTPARCVILVEKDAIFQRMLDEQIFSTLGSVILVTGKGYPDLSTRGLLNMLSTKLSVPVFALVDADPHGIEIASIVKWGSKMVSPLIDSRNYRVPNLLWLGLLPSEISSLSLSAESKMPLTEGDIRKLEKMTVHFEHEELWLNEVRILSSIGVKMELEALNDSNSRYLTSVYLKHKLSTYLDK